MSFQSAFKGFGYPTTLLLLTVIQVLVGRSSIYALDPVTLGIGLFVHGLVAQVVLALLKHHFDWFPLVIFLLNFAIPFLLRLAFVGGRLGFSLSIPTELLQASLGALIPFLAAVIFIFVLRKYQVQDA